MGPSVYIIESPSESDLVIGRNESSALAGMLRLAGIPHEVFPVGDKRTLVDALITIAQCVKNKRDAGQVVSTTIHLSAHGNEDGITLTKERVNWSQLRVMLLDLAQRTHRLNENGLALQELSVSACFGLHAAHMFGMGRPYPCVGVIGPLAEVDWADALTAWVVYYHQTLVKHVLSPDAVGAMNAASRIDAFFQFDPPDLPTLFSPGGVSSAAMYAYLLRAQSQHTPS